MTLKDVLEAMDREEIFLDELLDVVLEGSQEKSDRRWYVRTLVDTLSTEELKQEIKFRENPGSPDPFYP